MRRDGSAGVAATGSVSDPGPPDLRLAGFAVGAWLAALAGLYLSAVTGALAAVAASALVGALVAGRHRLPAAVRPHRWVLAGVLLGVLSGSAVTAAQVALRDAGPLAALVDAGAAVRTELVVQDDPRTAAGSPGRPPLWLVPARLTTVVAVHGDDPPVRLDVRVLVLATDPGWRPLLPGQRLAATGRLLRPRGGDLRAAVLSTREAPELRGAPSWWQRAAGSLRAGLQRACAPLADEPGGLLPGLVVGDTSRLEPRVAADFRATGMTHLNAVSGANVAIVLGLVLLLVRRTRAGPVVAAVLCAVALVGFVILARPSPSVVRAAAMGAVGLLGLAAGRPRAALPALAAGVAVLVLADPELAGDPGFALSVLATSGLLLIAPRWRDGLRAAGVPAGAAEALAVPAAAQVACAPVVAGLSGTVSLVALPANLLAVPAIAPATILGVTAAVLSPVWPTGAGYAAWLGGWPAGWLVTVARYGAQVPAGNLPWPGGVAGASLLAVLTLALVVAARRRPVRRLVAVVAAAAMLGSLPVRLVAPGWPPDGWVLAACDVGQGDAVVLPVDAGRAVVVDAGPDPAAVDRCLRGLAIRRVAVLVVSHFHVDHVAGLDGVLRDRSVAAVVTPSWPEPASGRRLVHDRAAAAGVPVGAVAAGWSYRIGAVELSVVGPPEPLAGTRSDPNNNSLVLRARVGGVTLLLTGDAEGEEQQAMLDRFGAAGLRADVLKVAHHGSAFQEPSFLDAVDPTVAVVSVGRRNDYGHPHPAVLARLARDGARVLRTDLGGDVAVLRTGRGLSVTQRGRSPVDRAG